jgi:hypothetical protein
VVSGFVSRVPVYLFLLWVARALHTLDGLSFSSHTHKQADFRQQQQAKKKKTKEKKDAGRCRKKNTEGIVVSRCRRPPRLITTQACDIKPKNGARKKGKKRKK